MDIFYKYFTIIYHKPSKFTGNNYIKNLAKKEDLIYHRNHASSLND